MGSGITRLERYDNLIKKNSEFGNLYKIYTSYASTNRSVSMAFAVWKDNWS